MTHSGVKDSAPHRLLRGAAIACSLGLAGFVVVNAQFGCDSSTTPPPAADPAPAPTPTPAAKAEPPAATQAAADEPRVEPAADPAAEPAANPAPEPTQPVAEPVFMPASKSGGDFGAMRFPGEDTKQAAEVANSKQSK